MGYIEGIMISACINIVCVAGLAILTGYAGLFSMGHACFLCLGAYTAGILTKYYGIPYFIALLAGGTVAGAFSLVIGVPTLRGKCQQTVLPSPPLALERQQELLWQILSILM